MSKFTKITIDFIPEAMPYQVVEFKNGRFGVYDFCRNTTMAAGMDLKMAADSANRLNYRHVWGQ